MAGEKEKGRKLNRERLGTERRKVDSRWSQRRREHREGKGGSENTCEELEKKVQRGHLAERAGEKRGFQRKKEEQRKDKKKGSTETKYGRSNSGSLSERAEQL